MRHRATWLPPRERRLLIRAWPVSQRRSRGRQIWQQFSPLALLRRIPSRRPATRRVLLQRALLLRALLLQALLLRALLLRALLRGALLQRALSQRTGSRILSRRPRPPLQRRRRRLSPSLVWVGPALTAVVFRRTAGASASEVAGAVARLIPPVSSRRDGRTASIAVGRRERIGPDRTELPQPVLGREIEAVFGLLAILTSPAHRYLHNRSRKDRPHPVVFSRRAREPGLGPRVACAPGRRNPPRLGRPSVPRLWPAILRQGRQQRNQEDAPVSAAAGRARPSWCQQATTTFLAVNGRVRRRREDTSWAGAISASVTRVVGFRR